MIYYRCTVCSHIERASVFISSPMHQHISGGAGIVFISLCAFKTLREARKAKVVTRKGRTGLKK